MAKYELRLWSKVEYSSKRSSANHPLRTWTHAPERTVCPARVGRPSRNPAIGLLLGVLDMSSSVCSVSRMIRCPVSWRNP